MVRADVFADKLKKLVAAMSHSDKAVNSKRTNKYVVTGLRTASAEATLAEAQISRRVYGLSGATHFANSASAIYDGNASAFGVSNKSAEFVRQICRGNGKFFESAEITVNEKVIFVDSFLERQAEVTIAEISGLNISPATPCYRGVAYSRFDGKIKEIDARGRFWTAKLVLTAGEKEIDCIIRDEDEHGARSLFEERCSVYGKCVYDGKSFLPARMHITRFEPIPNRSDLEKWRGAFSFIDSEYDEDELA